MSEKERQGEIELDEGLVDAVQRRRSELGADLPRFALFLFDCTDSDALRRTIQRIPKAADEWFEEVVLMHDRPSDEEAPTVLELVAGRNLDLRIHRQPRESGHGGARKAAFEYALGRRFDHVITMRGDGLHPPEKLPELVHAALLDPGGMLLASRLVHRLETLRAGMPIARLAAHTLATGFQNRVLGLRLRDYHTSYRLYSARALERIPFQLNANDRGFEMQIVIQCRALGVSIREVEILPAWREYAGAREALVHVTRACATAVDYRLHQLHLTRRGRYFVDEDVPYTFKRSRTGSHMQIVQAIRPGSRVLDLGCSQGLLARPLAQKDVRVTGVDTGPPQHLAAELEDYHQRDLEQPLELPVGRVFDYVVVSDVIEHLRNRTPLLRSVRRFLKQDGRLIISTPNIALWFYRLSLLAGRFEYGPRGVLDETHVHLFTRATFRREVEKAGFRILKEGGTALPFEVVFRSTGRSRLVRWMALAYYWLARRWPSMFAYQHILEAEIITLDADATRR